MRTPNLTPPNYVLFDSWTQESSYILGLWYSDGGLELDRKPSGIYKIVGIYNTDYQLISDVHKVTGGNIITKYPRNKNHKVYYNIRIYSDRLFDHLYALVGTNHKSQGNDFDISIIPDHCFNHFVRGLFDGDGSIYLKNYRNRHGKLTTELGTSFTAGRLCESFLVSLRTRLISILPLYNKKITGTISKKLVFSQYDSGILCEWMYEDAIISMKRKKDVWDNVDKDRVRRSKIYQSHIP